MTIPRHEYFVELDAMPPAPLLPAAVTVRIPSTEDADALAELMLDAYRSTIDYDDETHSEGSPLRAEGPPARAFGWCDLRNGGNAALIQAQLPERGLRAF